MKNLDFDEFITQRETNRSMGGMGQVTTNQWSGEPPEEQDFSDEDQETWDEWESQREEMQERRNQLYESLVEQPVNHGSTYLHICNSGVSVSVVDEGHGPTVKLSSSAFGGFVNDFKFHTDPQTLRILGMLFLSASEQEFTETYCHAVTFSSGEISDAEDLNARAEQLGFDLEETRYSCLPPRPREPPRMVLRADPYPVSDEESTETTEEDEDVSS